MFLALFVFQDEENTQTRAKPLSNCAPSLTPPSSPANFFHGFLPQHSTIMAHQAHVRLIPEFCFLSLPLLSSSPSSNIVGI